jgi:hypothetical protein
MVHRTVLNKKVIPIPLCLPLVQSLWQTEKMGEDRLLSCAKGATGWTSNGPCDFNINYGLIVGAA